jgi:hypothetical protein
MKPIIIGIHGLGNKPPKQLLDTWWRTAIREGLRNLGHDRPLFPFDLMYWATYLHPVPEDPAVTAPDDPLYLKEPYVPSSGKPPPEPGENRRKVLDFIEKEMDSLLLNDDLTIRYGAITDMIIHHSFRDLDAYYSTECTDLENRGCLAKQAIVSYVSGILKKYRGRRIMLIAHSMGSIIAYDALASLGDDIAVDTLVTMGSPLGIPVVMSRIASDLAVKPARGEKLSTPSNVTRRWYNISDISDRIAMNYNLGDDYDPNALGVRPEDMIVQNDYETGGEYNPHKIYGYLRTPGMARIVHEFLTSGGNPIMNRIGAVAQRTLARFI